jgi:hypothetical protein
MAPQDTDFGLRAAPLQWRSLVLGAYEEEISFILGGQWWFSRTQASPDHASQEEISVTGYITRGAIHHSSLKAGES